MKSLCTLKFEYPSEELARSVAKAVGADNEGFVDMRVEGCSIVAEIEADGPSSLLHTIDDLLVCIGAAEQVLNLNSARD